MAKKSIPQGIVGDANTRLEKLMSEPRPSQDELHAAITTQGEIAKTISRLIVEDVTSVMARNMSFVLKELETIDQRRMDHDRELREELYRRHDAHSAELDKLIALIGEVGARLGKAEAVQAAMLARLDEVDERQNTQYQESKEDRADMREQLADLRSQFAEVKEWAAALQQQIDAGPHITPDEARRYIAILERLGVSDAER